MKKNSDVENVEKSGLFLGSEPLPNVRYRAAHDDDKTDKGDTGDDDAVDTDPSDTDGTDKRDSDTRDSDGKD